MDRIHLFVNEEFGRLWSIGQLWQRPTIGARIMVWWYRLFRGGNVYVWHF